MKTRITPRLVIASLLILFVPLCFGETDESGSTERSADALKINTGAAKSYVFGLAGEPRRELVFHPASLLRWSNPLAGEVYGDVFIWTHQGRPEVIGSMHQWYSPFTHGSHEFHSLATGPISGTRDGDPVWTSEQPGIQLRRVPDQQSVAGSPVVRLTQMRAISRHFTGQKTDREGVSRELRLLPQPIYRYASDNSQAVLDGALFVFVQGTDPEILLLVEARPVGDLWEWQYGLARLNSVQFVAKYQDREVWRVETWPWSKVKSGQEPYTNFGPFSRSKMNE
ncbi:MAG: hypothetical protein O3C40_33905 [Planctomycetota bacterium]|nr:hypothetical protein [Planctomycetota bacterium]